MKDIDMFFMLVIIGITLLVVAAGISNLSYIRREIKMNEEILKDMKERNKK